MDKLKLESEKFKKLLGLCTSPGFVHALAHVCFRDNVIDISDELTADYLINKFSAETLLRTEISTLIGLMIQNEISLELPPPNIIQTYIDRIEILLKELHEAILEPMMDIFTKENINNPNFKPFTKGEILRESFFYGPESAYIFQYNDLIVKKYGKDNVWMKKNKGFSIFEAQNVFNFIGEIQNEKIENTIHGFMNIDPSEWTILPAFICSIKEISSKSNIEESIVKSVLREFCTDGIDNLNFKSIGDFNENNARPFIKISSDKYILFQQYSLAESLYESPFYWMIDDDDYKSIANQNRAYFSEDFCEERLKHVFGPKRVFKNVNLYKSKKMILGEIDVLVLFGNRALIVQNKTKKMTIESRKGNDRKIRDDFKAAVQDAYDQGFKCAEALSKNKCKMNDPAPRGGV